MNLRQLHDELTDDPELIGYDTMSDQQAADALNAVNRPSFQAISGAALLRWSAAGAVDDLQAPVPARIVRIKLASERAVPFDGLNLVSQGYAAAAVAAIGAAIPLSYDDPAVRGMIVQLAADGVLTSSEADELAALGTTMISRATELSIGTVRVGDVTAARAIS